MDVYSNMNSIKKEKTKVFLGVFFFCFCIFAKMKGSFQIWAAGVIFLLLGVIAVNDLKISIKINKRQVLTFVAWLVFCISYVLTSNINEALNGIIQMTMFFLIIVYGKFIADTYGELAVEKMFMGICNIIFITALYGIFEYLTSSNPLKVFFYVQKELLNNDNSRTMSIYLHPIYFSQVLVIGICINYFFNKSYTKKIIYYFALIFALYTTKTRGAWLAFGVLLTVVFINWIVRKHRINSMNIFLGLLSIVGLVILNLKFGIIANIVQRFEELDGGASFGQRAEAINYIMDRFNHSSILGKFIGHGVLGTYHELSKVTFFYQNFVATDNQWVSWIYNNGIIFVLFVIAFTIYAVKIFFETNDNITKFMVIIYLVYLGLSFFVEIGSAFAGNLFLFIPIGYLLNKEIKKEKVNLNGK